ncbi:unnamed protein product [Gongylonema pulchrum]|uniref:DUF3402 domain-containing protein n=1 Tax=Gongylonema pulchrum TaxID=637853 RepID=A0A183D0V7_9BILA|nr:unnamed protein product [Gongylonema pulchrum]
MLRNLGAPFPVEWQLCKYTSCFWTSFKLLQLLLADCCHKIEISVEDPLALTDVDFLDDYVPISDGTPPYPMPNPLSTSLDGDESTENVVSE